MRPLKHAFRVLFKTPFVTTIAIVSLALGIGANSAIFSMFDQMLLRRLPVPDPNDLVNLSAPGPKPGSNSCGQAGSCQAVFSYPMYRDLEAKQTALAGIVAHRSFGANFMVRNEPSNGDVLLVSGSYFPVLGLRPTLGRLLTESDDAAPGANFVVVLNHRFWKNRLGSDSSVVDQQILVNGQSMTVVGVGPEGFDGTTLGSVPVAYAPISMREELVTNSDGTLEQRRSYWIYVFGRLKAGGNVEQAERDLNAIYKPIINEIEVPLQRGMSEQTLVQFRNKSIEIEPGARGQSQVHAEASTPLLMLFAVTGVVLLIACANIANLLLARGAGRAMEMGVRLSLGATRRQLLSQLLLESVLLAALGGIASVGVAKLTLGAIAAMLPPDATGTLQFTIHPSVLVFTGALSIATGLLFGMFPALHSTRSDLVSAVRSNTGTLGGGRGAARFRATLVTAQIALSTALLISAGLFLKSLVNVSKIDLGLNVENMMTFGVSPDRSGYDGERAATFFRRVEEELAALPGATGVTSTMVPLLAGSSWGTSVQVQGFPSGPDVDNESRYSEIGPDYFRLLGIPLLAGREFTAYDAGPNTTVAIVNETFARKFNLGRDAVGKFMSLGSDSLNIQIVGLVKDAGYADVKDTIPPLFYVPWRQDQTVGSLYFLVRTTQPPETMLRSIPALVRRIDPGIPVEELKTMPQQVRESVFLDRMISTMSASFAFLATLLAGIGLYGVLAYTVAQRTREIGVRMALGANSTRVRTLVMKQVAWMMGIGAGIGVAAAVGLGRAAQSLLYGLAGNDPLVFGLSILLLCLVALAAGFVPAQRAARVNPISALRYE
jgi:predicted permease